MCGYVHQVPSYWMGFAAEDETQQMHFDPRTQAVCANQTLDYAGTGETD